MTQFKKGDRVRFVSEGTIITNWGDGDYNIMLEGVPESYTSIHIPAALVSRLTLLPPAIKAGDYVARAGSDLACYKVEYAGKKAWLLLDRSGDPRLIYPDQFSQYTRLASGRPSDFPPPPEAGE